MIQIIIWLGALLCTNPTHTLQNHGNCPLYHMGGISTLDDGPGETGGTPKPPTPPPPPPPSGPGE